MDSTNLVFIAGSFIVVIALFVFALFKFVLSKPKNKEMNIDVENSFEIDTVMMVLDSSQSSLDDIKQVIDRMFDEYERLDPDKQKIKNILIALSLHVNAEKDIIINTQKRFQDKHPELEIELEKAVKKGLDNRGLKK
ncbi:hypothetical protein [Helicobacter muridarum]|uniref:Uncharacterized protein n=2 Tax=Helicobacter muridarum TaxID=216 RepID=A0A099TU87_9HELI|nr:hypothetical protein [Helicobacter muridarum]STQ86171.1 Uncharacterised protein [Helicobacter muridarum]